MCGKAAPFRRAPQRPESRLRLDSMMRHFGEAEPRLWELSGILPPHIWRRSRNEAAESERLRILNFESLLHLVLKGPVENSREAGPRPRIAFITRRCGLKGRRKNCDRALKTDGQVSAPPHRFKMNPEGFTAGSRWLSAARARCDTTGRNYFVDPLLSGAAAAPCAASSAGFVRFISGNMTGDIGPQPVIIEINVRA